MERACVAAHVTRVPTVGAHGRPRCDTLALFDRYSANTLYSTQAANAAAVVASKQGDKFAAFMAALYAHQLAENTPGLTDADIADLARGAGVSDAVASSFTDTVRAATPTPTGPRTRGRGLRTRPGCSC